MAPTSMAPIPASPPARPTEALEQRVSDTGLAPVWTDEDEEELADIKAKLHQAHKSWSEEQELWHERHEELEDLKRAWLKSEKKRAKAAKKEAGKESGMGEEGCEGKLEKVLRRFSGPLVPRRRSNTTSQSITEEAEPAVSQTQSNSSSISDFTSKFGRLRAKSMGGGKEER